MYKAIEAMGAKLAPKNKIDKLMQDDMYVGQIKIDGFRLSAEKRGGKVRLFGRGTGKYASRTEYTELLPHIIQILEMPFYDDGKENSGLPDDTIVDGEIAYLNADGGADYNKTSNVMGSLPERAIQLQKERGFLTFQIFDVLEYAGLDLTNESFTVRDSFIFTLHLAGRLNSEYIKMVGSIFGTIGKKLLLENELAAGREGIMLKNINSKYIPGKKRENTWYKVKAESDADVVIIGYTEPDEFTQIMHDGKKVVDADGDPVMARNRYYDNNWIGSIVIGQYVPVSVLSNRQWKYINQLNVDDICNEIRDGILYYLVPVGKVSSGLADDVRDSISKARGEYLMKKIMIKYFKRTDDSYYLPRLVRFRDEKPIEECIWGE